MTGVQTCALPIYLYFQKFEFNASIYYLVRWAGYQIYGYNIIATAGLIMGVVVCVLILLLAYFEKRSDMISLPVLMLFSLSIYFMFATVVHPWYIATLVFLSVFTKYRYAIAWSFLVILSYSAYQTETYTENYLLIAIEYGLVFGWMLYEIRQSFRKDVRFPVRDN